MRPVTVSLAALGNSAWVPINQLQVAFAIGLGCSVTSGASLTYKVQHTFDDPGVRRAVSVSRSGTVATVVDNDHRLSVNDSVFITGTGSANLDGTFDIASIVDANTYTYTVANSGATTDQGNTYVTSFRVYDNATITGQTGRIDGNYAFPVQCLRLKTTIYASGKVDLTILQAMGH